MWRVWHVICDWEVRKTKADAPIILLPPNGMPHAIIFAVCRTCQKPKSSYTTRKSKPKKLYELIECIWNLNDVINKTTWSFSIVFFFSGWRRLSWRRSRERNPRARALKLLLAHITVHTVLLVLILLRFSPLLVHIYIYRIISNIIREIECVEFLCSMNINNIHIFIYILVAQFNHRKWLTNVIWMFYYFLFSLFVTLALVCLVVCTHMPHWQALRSAVRHIEFTNCEQCICYIYLNRTIALTWACGLKNKMRRGF